MRERPDKQNTQFNYSELFWNDYGKQEYRAAIDILNSLSADSQKAVKLYVESKIKEAEFNNSED